MSEAKIEARRQAALKRKKKLQKQQNAKIKPGVKKGLIGCVAGLVVLVIIAVIVFFNAGFVKRSVTAVTVGDEKVSAAEFSYYYNEQVMYTINMYYQYFGGQYMPFDVSKPLSGQKYSEDQSWSEYFVDQTISGIQNVKVLKQAAEAEGYTLSQEGAMQVEQTISQLTAYATQANMTFDRYLQSNYGNGLNQELMKKMLTEQVLASEYSDVLRKRPTYTDEQLENYYQNEGKDSFTYVDVRYLAFNQVAATEGSAGKTLEEAKAEAEAFLQGITDEESFSKKALEELKARQTDSETEVTDNTLHTAVLKSTLASYSTAMSDWAFGEKTLEGTSGVYENTNGTGYYVAYLVKKPYRHEYKTVDIRQIYIAAADPEKEESMNEAKAKAEAIYDEWQAGAATEETFAALADEKSELSYEGGLQEKLTKGDDEISDWLFDEARQKGDTVALASSSGYHVIYYMGQNTEYWKLQVEDALRSADYDALYKTIEEKYPVSRNNVGLGLRKEPTFQATA